MLEFACDVLIDIPKFWEFLGEIVAPSLASGALRLAPFFEETTAALAKGPENSPDFSGETMEISIGVTRGGKRDPEKTSLYFAVRTPECWMRIPQGKVDRPKVRFRFGRFL